MSDEGIPPEGDSPWKIVHHVVDEMPWRVVGALVFIVFFFFYGMMNSLIKVFGYDVASIDFPIGVVFGGVIALAVLVVCIAIKLRRK